MIDRISEVVGAHWLERYDRRAWWCSCGVNCMTIEGSHAAHVSELIVQAMGLTEEINSHHPVSVAEFDADGNPVMDERMVPDIQKRHFEWVEMRRWITPWTEVGERETSE